MKPITILKQVYSAITGGQVNTDIRGVVYTQEFGQAFVDTIKKSIDVESVNYPGLDEFVDYKALLKKYIQHVSSCEGVDFINSGDGMGEFESTFNNIEQRVLKLISDNYK